jgi:hypothetical protein
VPTDEQFADEIADALEREGLEVRRRTDRAPAPAKES